MKVEVRADVGWLTLNRPARMNAIRADSWTQLGDKLRALESRDLRAIVMRGAGGNFCSGGDLESFDADPETVIRDVAETIMALAEMTTPTVAVVDGVAMGAGLSLALLCDLLVVSDSARLGFPFVHRGITPDAGVTWIVPQIVGRRLARELLLTGETLSAAAAHAAGLIPEPVSDELLECRVDKVLHMLTSAAPLAVRGTKALLGSHDLAALEEVLRREGHSQVGLMGTNDVAEAVDAFRHRRPPRFYGR